MNEKMLQIVSELRAPFLKFRAVMSQIVFGSSQQFGHRIFSNSVLVPTQSEEWAKNVSTFTCFGPPASGKTTAAKAYSMLMACPTAFVVWGPELTSGQLYGFLDYSILDKNEQPKYRPGALTPGSYNMFICDELVRGAVSRLNDLGPIFAEGKIMIEGRIFDIAPPDEPLIIVATSNPLGSAGTKRAAEFIVDRLIAGTIFDVPKENLRQLLQPQKHWRRIREQGLLTPVLSPRMIMQTRRFVEQETNTPDHIIDYMEEMLGTIDLLTHHNWANRFPREKLPPKWRAMKRIPTAPLFHQMGGRIPQHLESLSRADSFLTYGSLQTIVNRSENSVQAMALAVLAHRFMYHIHEGGIDIRDAAHEEDILDFVRTATNWVVSLVPLPTSLQRAPSVAA
ncbi:MAG: hypothetical protein G01um101448_12 [Parcubacteria group bacterium Gr01-1014_48]|nr:MAG: hypothetical protein Greene041614_374 [Parcubacteria group bacterium Greene0416_14]TSC74597.1 MAG: hypothetical protein G01um101448_12 [Parcubacteria group bacterium Gr01-1014_48]TSD01604.1 MAG: hypothetical protein Greene101415_184 [Parcubacteria group bacterium Greene1014_15]TSD08347.1 MAG: hypothetical protein Greene07144_142 [Parcubacteria group bacterium Greene0714_4]